ncbi:lanthionine synthetase LanC family protein [Myceligenerans pegani]|uniref:Lanthionine synthetase n=1 Tax=Myceligenerans pegani TaxID=2776917 RepID=A0ABR9MUI9_9MICO|nr:lanthionine synthetase LanC family protein [Myceligenerans sp. TRM 65318]MBE1875044.1 lanthionine synthetase [Myceligenerans sp. TRM 65318]MBE3017315.1 lanthionine synthetase [Myceligenerans sp. TRM 65318]
MSPGEAAVAVAERLRDPDVVRQGAPPNTSATLAEGLPGTALLHARLSHLDPELGHAARAHWDTAALQAASTPLPGSGVHGVLGGLASSLIIGSPYLPDPDATADATARSVRWLSACAENLAEAYDASVRSGRSGTSWHIYDTISGLAGIGRVLLAALVAGHTSAESGLVAAVNAMTTMLTDRDGFRPGWWVATDEHPDVVAARLDSTGAADTGLAHGVAGPLALLALAHSTGYGTGDGQETAIRGAVAWLRRWKVDKRGWPAAISGRELDADGPPSLSGRRAAWCYGVPGIARALLHAADALDDDELAAEARADFAGLAAQPGRWDVESPGLCHGYAGVLRCSLGVDRNAAHHAARGVMAALDPTQPFLFPDIEHGSRFARPGFLTGAAGVALALAEHDDLATPVVGTSWDALLLIS